MKKKWKKFEDVPVGVLVSAKTKSWASTDGEREFYIRQDEGFIVGFEQDGVVTWTTDSPERRTWHPADFVTGKFKRVAL